MRLAGIPVDQDGLEVLGDSRKGCSRGGRLQRRPPFRAPAGLGLKDLCVFNVKKETKKGEENEYWHAARMVEGKARNVYVVSCKGK